MTIPKLEGFDEEVGPALAQLTDMIGSLVKPTAKYDHQLKALFMEKPELMQKFVDVEKENPGTLRAFGFGEGATDFLSGMKQSIPSIRMGLGRNLLESDTAEGANARRTAGQQEATNETPAEATGGKLREWMLNGGLELMREDPRAADAAIRNLLNVPSAHKLEVEADTAAAYQEGKRLQDMSVPEIIQGLQSGKISNRELSGAGLHPASQLGVEMAMKLYQQEREGEIRRDLLRTPRPTTSQALETSLRRAAYDQYKASGGVAPIGAFYERMWGQPYNGASASQEDLAKVDQWLQTSQRGKEVDRNAKLIKAIEPLYTATIRKKNQPPPPKELIHKNIKQINDLLTAAGSDWRAEYDEIDHWWPKANEPKIVFRNSQGIVSPDISPVISQVPTGNEQLASDNPPPLSPYQRQILMQLQSLPDEQIDSVLSQMLDAAGDDPDALQQVQNIMDNLPAR